MKSVNTAGGIAWRPVAPRAFARILGAALFCLAAAACGPRDPLDGKVDAGDAVSFSMWKSRAGGGLSALQQADMDQAVQEIRFHVMAEGKVTGRDAVEGATLQAMDERTVRYVLQLGLGWELQRAEAERSAIQAAMGANALLRTRPGDRESAAYLSDLHERQVIRLRAATEEVRRTRERLSAAGMPAASAARASPSP